MEPVSTEAYAVRALACLPTLFVHVCTSNISKARHLKQKLLQTKVPINLICLSQQITKTQNHQTMQR